MFPLLLDFHQGAPKRFEVGSLFAAADGRVAGFCIADGGPPASALGCTLNSVATGEVVHVLDDLAPSGEGYSFEAGPIGHDANIEISCELGMPTSSEPVAALDRSVFDTERIHVPAPRDESAATPDRKERKLRVAQARGGEREFKKITKALDRAVRRIVRETTRELRKIARDARSAAETDTTTAISEALASHHACVGAERIAALQAVDAARVLGAGTPLDPGRSLDLTSGVARDSALFVARATEQLADGRISPVISSIQYGSEGRSRFFQFTRELNKLSFSTAFMHEPGSLNVFVDVPTDQADQVLRVVAVSESGIVTVGEERSRLPSVCETQEVTSFGLTGLPAGLHRLELQLVGVGSADDPIFADFELIEVQQPTGRPVDPFPVATFKPSSFGALVYGEILGPKVDVFGDVIAEAGKRGGPHEGIIAVPGRNGFVLVNQAGEVVDQGVRFEALDGLDYTTVLLFHDPTQPDFAQYRVMWGGPRTFLLNNYFGGWSASISLDASSGITTLVTLGTNDDGLATRFLVVRPGRDLVTEWSPGQQRHILSGLLVPVDETGLVVSACQDPATDLYYFLFERQDDENRSFLYWSDGASSLEGGIECGRGARVACVAGNQLFVGNEDTQDVWHFVRGEDDRFEHLRTLPATGSVRSLATNVVASGNVQCMFADGTSMQFFSLDDADGSTPAYEKIDVPAGVRHMTASGDGGFNASGTNPDTGEDFLLLVDCESYVEVLGPDFVIE